MYVHGFNLYGVNGGYLSMAPYPHRQWAINTAAAGIVGTLDNSYKGLGDPDPAGDYRRGSLTQLYNFGIQGSTRPHLEFHYPKAEILNNPFLVQGTFNTAGAGDDVTLTGGTNTRICTIQSTSTGGDALWILQANITVRNSRFIEVAGAFSGAMFGEENVLTPNYIPPIEGIKRIEEGKKAHELANKKRKIKNVKDLQLPLLNK